MRHILILVTCLIAAPLHAGCYADYKAQKNDGGLKLHYGVVSLSDRACENNAIAESETQSKIAVAGWLLSRLVSTFDDSQLAAKKKNAGEFFLKY